MVNCRQISSFSRSACWVVLLTVGVLLGCGTPSAEPPPAAVAERADPGADRLNQLAQALAAPKAADRVRAIDGIAALGPAAQRLGPKLQQLADHDPDLSVRAAAAAALAKVQPTP